MYVCFVAFTCRNEDLHAVKAAGSCAAITCGHICTSVPDWLDSSSMCMYAFMQTLSLMTTDTILRASYVAFACRNEDFYAVKAAGRCPEFDVLVTNPPFSGDHLERIFRFAVKSDK